MIDLFGRDIAGQIARGFQQAGGLRPGVLTKRTGGERDPDNPTRRLPATPTEHAYQGFEEKRSIRRADSLIVETISVLSILGGSITPAAVPEVNDNAELDGEQFELIRLILRDPAAALYEFEVR